MEGDGMTTHRLLRIVRMHFVNPWTTIGIPLIALCVIFAANLAIWAIIAASASPADLSDAQDGLQYSGATGYLFFYMAVVAIQAITRTFPFATGFGATRRDFFLGTALSFVALSVGYGALLTALGYLESATGGWGLGGRMFTAVYFGDGPWYQKLFVFVGGMLFFFFLGALGAILHLRWRATGLLAAGGVIVVATVGAIALLVATNGWNFLGDWIVTATPVDVVTWMLAATLLAAIIGFLVLRRATPRG